MPTLKAILIVAVLISVYCFFVLIGWKLRQIIISKFLEKQEVGKEYIPIEKINLKGRLKRCPNTVNYNELFNNESKSRKKTNKNNSNNPESSEKIYNFVDRVNEKQEFDKLFSKQEHIKREDFPKNETEINIKQEINKSKENNAIDQPNNHKSDNILDINFQTVKNNENLIDFSVGNKNQDQLDKLLSKESNVVKISEEINNSRPINNRLNNSALFRETPLTRIRNNSYIK